LPSEWVTLLKNANKKNPFDVIHVNYFLTDDLKSDFSEICKVYDYKSLLDPSLKSQKTHLTGVRRMKFTKNNIKD
jgi:hypothetical protein